MLARDVTSEVLQRLPFVLATICVIALLLAAILVAPLYIWAKKPHASMRRKATALGVGYLITMTILGGYTYVIVPVQYTHYLKLSWPPSSTNSLWAIHDKYEGRLRSPGAISTPEGAVATRELIDSERQQFLIRWIALTLALATPVVLLMSLRPAIQSRSAKSVA